MTALLLSFFILLAGGLSAAALRHTRMQWIGPWSAMAGATTAAFAGLRALLAGTTVDIAVYWQIPMGSLHLGLDPLSALFVSLIAVIGVLAAAYGRGYLADIPGRGKVAMSWCWYNFLLAAMLLVVTARNGFLFLVAWEVMSLASFFLVMFDHEKDEVLRAGWIYLTATHLGTAFLLAMFLVLGCERQPGFRRLNGVRPAGRLCFCGGPDRFRNQSRFRTPARLAAGGTSGRSLPRFGPDERGHDQNRHLRSAARDDVSGAAHCLVGVVAGRDWSGVRCCRRSFCAGAARLEATAGLPQRREYRHHRPGPGNRHLGDRFR